jgi:hypothetical protein
MSHLYIKDIQAGQQIQDTYMLTQPVLRNTTKGDLYIAMFLSDKTGLSPFAARVNCIRAICNSSSMIFRSWNRTRCG